MATVNFIHNAKQSASALGGAKRYVEKEEKTLDKFSDLRLVSGQNCTPQFADKEFLATRMMHHKDSPVYFYHYTQSFSPEEKITGQQAHEIAKEFAARAWPESEVLIATHIDAAHIHSHFIVNAVCYESGKMLRQGPNTLKQLRQISDEICLAHGLSVLSPQPKQKVRGMGTREYRSAEKGESWKFRLMNTIDECMKYAETPDEFISLMRSEGYDVKWTGTRKSITYTTPTGMKCRDDRLHEEKYLKEYMEHEFTIRQPQVLGRAESGEQNESFKSSGDAVLRDTDGAKLEGGHLSPLWDSPASGSGRGYSKKTADEERRGGSTETDGRKHAGPPLESAIGGTKVHRTGWEDEREFFLRRREAGYEYGEETVFDDGVYGTAPEQFDFDSGAMDAENSYSRNNLGGITDDLIRLGYAAAGIVNDAPVQDTTTMPHHTDSKQRRKEQSKRIALGHKPDDHEQQQTWQQTMY